FYEFGPQATAPSTCTGTGWSQIDTNGSVSNNSASPTAGFTPNQAGTYWLYATYSGDTNNNTANSPCPSTTSINVAKASPTLAVSGPASGTAGTAISASSITGTLSSSSGTNAGGTITF